MDTDLEQAGALVNVGLAGAAIEGRAAASGAYGPAPCLNCGSPLSGRFCASCGQAAHLHRSLLHLLEELLHNVLHFDAKGWRTLPLLAARPGLLTRRYIDGQRMRYISPLALFLFNSFLMFFVISLVAEHVPVTSTPMDPAQRLAARQRLAEGIQNARQQVEKARTELEEAQRSGRNDAAAKEKLSDAVTEQRVAETAFGIADQVIAHTQLPPTAGAVAASEAANAEPVKRGLQQLADLKINTGIPWIDETVQRALQNPELFLYRAENTAYKYLFMLIPISLPFLWLMFAWRRDVTGYDHAVFSIYSLSFMTLLLVVCVLLIRAGWSELGTLALLCAPPVHMFVQLRGTYALGIFSAFWRTLALIAVAGTAFVLFVLLVILISLR
jgi:hypothetical protein